MLDQFARDREFDMTLNARTMWAAFAASGAKKKGGGNWSLRDFLPPFKRRQKAVVPKPTEELVAMARHLNKMHGGTDLTQERVSGNSDR